MNLRREPQHSQNSGDSSASDSFPASNVGLIGDLVGLNESLPLDGLPEEFDDSGGLGFSIGALRQQVAANKVFSAVLPIRGNPWAR